MMHKDNTNLIAAALGLRSSAWAQAVVHITEPKFNAAINGEQVIKDGKTMQAHEMNALKQCALKRFGYDNIPHAYGRGFIAARGGRWSREDNPYTIFKGRSDVDQDMVATMEQQWFYGWDDYEAANA